MPQVPGVISFVVEVRCPHCQNMNRFQPLSAVHSNIKTSFLKKADSVNFAAKCMTCEKPFQVVKTVFI
jgi:phage FluMu protein Com